MASVVGLGYVASWHSESCWRSRTHNAWLRHSVVTKRKSLGCHRRPAVVKACNKEPRVSSQEHAGSSNENGPIAASLSCENKELLPENRLETHGAAERLLSSSVNGKAPLAKASGKYYYEDAELLSRSTSVAERSAIALATMAYERAKRLFNLVSSNLNDLENNFKKRLKIFGSVSSTTFAGDAGEDSRRVSEEAERNLKRLNIQVLCLQQELCEKDHQLQLALAESKLAYEKLRALQDSFPRVIHDVDVIEVPVEAAYNDIDEAEEKTQHELIAVEEKVAGLLDKVQQLNGLVAGWKSAFDLLQRESQHTSEALQLSARELANAEEHIGNLKSLTERQASEIAAKNSRLSDLEGEVELSRQKLENALKSLSDIEQQRDCLEDALDQEKEALVAAVRSSTSHKEALAVAEKKIADLTSEIDFLKSDIEDKEELIHNMREDARRNANMLVSAAKTREALLIAEKRIEQLNNQVSALEEEVKSRDLILNDIKEEAVQSTEALRLAAEIKKDLNSSRQRELELSQELEKMKDIVKDLRQEVVENNRAVRAEQALRQLENEMDEVTAEVEILRKGVEARDEAIQLMKEEVDRNIDVLSHAAGNRELVRDLEEHIEELKAELRKKDVMLAAMGKGLDAGSTSSTSSLYKSNSRTSTTTTTAGDLYDEPADYSLPSSSSPSSSTFEASKPRKRAARNTNGYKRIPRQSS